MLHYKRYGKGESLVLLHGYAGGIGYWLPLIMGLKNGFDIIAVDLPGFAGSAGVPAPVTISGYAASVVELMDQLGVEKAHVLGFSMGGMIAQQLVLDSPDRASSLVLYGSSAIGDLPHRFEPWQAAIDRIEREGVEGTNEKTCTTWFVEGPTHPYFPMCRDAGRGANKESCITVMKAMQVWSSMDRLGEIDLPTFIVVGDKDRSTKPSDSIVLWEGIPNSQFCILPNCAHGAHVEKPELFNKVLIDFLVENSARS